MTERKAIAALIESAMAAGRCNEQIINILSADELNQVFVDFIERVAADARRTEVKVCAPSTIAESGRKIDLIKTARNICGISLKDAKDFSEGSRITISAGEFDRLAAAFAPYGGITEAPHA